MTSHWADLLAVYTLAVAPWLAHFNYGRLAQRVSAGDCRTRRRFYGQLLLKQTATSAAVCALWWIGRVPAAHLGLVPPRSWPITAGMAAPLVSLFVWSALRRRHTAGAFLDKLRERGGRLLPQSRSEHPWFAAISVGAGISEELTYRGFWFYYLGARLPGISLPATMALTSAIFAAAHVYQGRRGVVASGVSGLIMAALYVLTGSVLLPIAIHSAGNLRASLILWPSESGMLWTCTDRSGISCSDLSSSRRHRA
jgi:membrane protease YdiL (CAAX protease family)